MLLLLLLLLLILLNTVAVPFIPNLENDMDTRNFDEEFTKMDLSTSLVELEVGDDLWCEYYYYHYNYSSSSSSYSYYDCCCCRS